MPTTKQKHTVVHAYVAVFEAGSADAAAALFADNATVEDPVGTPIKRGRDEIHAFYAASMATGAKLELTGDLLFAGDYVAFPFKVKLSWGGQDSVIEVIDTFKLDDDGKIIEMRAFWGPENMKAV
jgi:steroid delta-isomerase